MDILCGNIETVILFRVLLSGAYSAVDLARTVYNILLVVVCILGVISVYFFYRGKYGSFLRLLLVAIVLLSFWKMTKNTTVSSYARCVRNSVPSGISGKDVTYGEVFSYFIEDGIWAGVEAEDSTNKDCYCELAGYMRINDERQLVTIQFDMGKKSISGKNAPLIDDFYVYYVGLGDDKKWTDPEAFIRSMFLTYIQEKNIDTIVNGSMIIPVVKPSAY